MHLPSASVAARKHLPGERCSCDARSAAQRGIAARTVRDSTGRLKVGTSSVASRLVITFHEFVLHFVPSALRPIEMALFLSETLDAFVLRKILFLRF